MAWTKLHKVTLAIPERQYLGLFFQYIRMIKDIELMQEEYSFEQFLVDCLDDVTRTDEERKKHDEGLRKRLDEIMKKYPKATMRQTVDLITDGNSNERERERGKKEGEEA